MRRWNGWGDVNTVYPLPDSAIEYLAQTIGVGSKISDAQLEEIQAQLPASRLSPMPLINQEAIERVFHARGQSLPDWVAMRSGKINAFPDGVAYPNDEADIRKLLAFASKNEILVIPYGGGTSVVGHINPLPSVAPTLTIDLSRLNRLLDLDETSRLATFEAGVNGPRLEAQLAEHGYTLGHFPQSFELSTLGGWIAARSSGQQSYYYGRIEDLFAGGHIETPCGALDLPALPASAAGPDLRQAILGSEGRLGILTQATVRIQPRPPMEAFYGVFFHDWEAGVEAMRRIAQERTPISMARLSNAQETETTLALSGKEALVQWANRGLRLVGYDAKRCLLIFGVTGTPAACAHARRQTLQIAHAQGGLFTGQVIGKIWRKSRFLTPYLRNTLWELGYAVDTLETALPWSNILLAAEEIQAALKKALNSFNERCLVMAHLSHIYSDGASIYVTFIFRRSEDPEETLERWKMMKSAASQAIIQHRGTISHQHGVGVDHAAYLEAEKSALGIALIRQMAHTVDPKGILNPGKLFS